nr:N-acylneuraminate-9-phosphatase [Leptinotarsa decemlineata]
MRPNAIFFDMDNTIIPTRKADCQTMHELANILFHKYRIPEEEGKIVCFGYLHKFRECPENLSMDLDTWRQSLWAEALGENFKHLSEAVYKEWIELRYKILVVDPDVRDMLVELRKVYNLALITNGTSRAQWEKVNKLNLALLFDLIIVSGDYPWEKPDPNIFLDACRRLWVAPRRVIMIGDKLETDILGAVQSNLGGSIWTPREDSPAREPEDPEPSAVVRDMSDLQYAICRVEEKLNAEMQCPNSNELLNAVKYLGS